VAVVTKKKKPGSRKQATAGKGRLARYALSTQLNALAETLSGDIDLGWPHIGLETPEFPLLCERIDGFRNSLYVLAGASRMGKSSFALQLLVSLLAANPDARGLFITLEQPARELNIRLVASLGEASIEYLVNPTREGASKYDDAKQRGLERAFALRERLTIVDESLGAICFEDVGLLVEEIRRDFSGPLMLVIDPLFKLRVAGSPLLPQDELTATLAREIKTLRTSHQVGVIATTGVSGAAGKCRPELADLEPQSALLYDAHVIGLLYCDFFNNAETPFLEWSWGTDDLMVPIFELNIAKNKMASFSGRLYYRFFNSISKFKECVQLEKENYDRMLFNLRTHDGNDPIVDDQIIGRF